MIDALKTLKEKLDNRTRRPMPEPMKLTDYQYECAALIEECGLTCPDDLDYKKWLIAQAAAIRAYRSLR